jgi:hypothetical protein
LSLQNHQLIRAEYSEMANGKCQLADDKWVAIACLAVSYLFGMKVSDSELRQ